MARGNSTRAGDYTGTQKAQLAKENADAQKAKAASMAMVTAAAETEDKEPVDLQPKKPQVKEEVVGEVAISQDVDVQEEIVKFRVNETMANVTIGAGNHFDFEEGREYRAPKHVYDHLEEKGLVWH